MTALIIRWFTILPWRQRNVRECRIDGPKPNLFKGPIPLYAEIKKPGWVIAKEAINPHAEFWQFRFSKEETKTHKSIHALLPKQLIPWLEEYIERHRPVLLRGRRTNNLFVNRVGSPLAGTTIGFLVRALTGRFTGRQVNPHLIRDIVAYTWLDSHPNDYLTVSKMLWHSNINTTLKHYASRFNESNGVTAMEVWQDELQAKLTAVA